MASLGSQTGAGPPGLQPTVAPKIRQLVLVRLMEGTLLFLRLSLGYEVTVFGLDHLHRQHPGLSRFLQVSRPHVSAAHCTGKEKEARENPEMGLVECLS